MRLKNLRLIACFCIAVAALAVPLAASESVGRITVYSADEAAGFVLSDGGRDYLDFPGARRWELRSGSTEWSPMSLEEVVSAVEEIGYPVTQLNIDIVILHVPRVEVAESSAEGSVVFLTPGRGTYPTEHIHYTVVHEIGHIVHGALMPDARRGLWLRYADLRGFELNDGGPDVPHAWRPHEVFAEDFRALFGGNLAAFGGRVENHDLMPPAEVEGLREFFLSLAAGAALSAEVVVLPNPSAGEVLVRAPKSESQGGLRDVALYDVRGRLVRDLASPEAAREISWDGCDRSGGPVAPGVYVIRGLAGDTPFTHKVIRVLP